jgi:hypothetical protein
MLRLIGVIVSREVGFLLFIAAYTTIDAIIIYSNVSRLYFPKPSITLKLFIYIYIHI